MFCLTVTIPSHKSQQWVLERNPHKWPLYTWIHPPHVSTFHMWMFPHTWAPPTCEYLSHINKCPLHINVLSTCEQLSHVSVLEQGYSQVGFPKDSHVKFLRLPCNFDVKHLRFPKTCGKHVKTCSCASYLHVQWTINMWKLLMLRVTLMCESCSCVKETFTCGRYSHIEGEFKCEGDIHICRRYLCV